MSSLAEVLRYQIQFAAWANQRILAASSKLSSDQLNQDFGTSEKSIRGTLAHIYRAERVWLSRIEGPVVEFKVDGDDDFSALCTKWPHVGQRWAAWAQALTDPVAGSELTYQDLRKNNWTQPLWQIILHVVNHSTHHRGQAIGFIRTLGQTPPNVDLITFGRER
jgi:uncharacterized damage-inducible protein DinB